MDEDSESYRAKKQKVLDTKAEMTLGSLANSGHVVEPGVGSKGNISSSSVIPTHNEQKYDRQLRLWASSGQQALQDSHVLLIGASATGCEVAKNLILAGIGRLTVLDDSLVTDEDVQTNFFLNGDGDVGKRKSDCVVPLLNELNPDITCTSVSNNNSNSIEIKDLNLSQFNLIVASGLGPSHLMILNSELRQLNIPLIVVDSIGFYGYLRLCLAPSHEIVETHPDSLVDLRVDSPWPELVEHAKKYQDLDKFTSVEIDHIPFIVILINALDEWNKIHITPPSSYEEKSNFKKFIMDIARNRADTATAPDYENFEEAVASVYKLFQSSQTLPSELKRVLYDAKTTSEFNKSPFWTVAAAVRIFYEQPDVDGKPRRQLPLTGVLPDMKSSTDWFVALQQVYRDKSELDIAEIRSIITNLWTSSPTEHENNLLHLSDEYITTFCKNARYIRVVSGSPLEYATAGIDTQSIDPDDLHIYLAIRAYKLFLESTSNTSPPSGDEDLTEQLNAVTSQLSNTPTDAITKSTDVLNEILRAAGELYNSASFMGGIGAQEAIKIITHQYVPLNNTLVYDGITSRIGTFYL
ncbi:Ula1p [Sugiyamaella lignohabitans]|uniref:NEDD8-activating enzyme E1 regulatory subunit n=1 Tax=Sugiyamaella lignohabitans TaxID=796027 RepID=A0A167EIS0_9ASCO|nr:Ula1p [Sugiyamaella lignohabitans]ANB14129.1 Ula1p [Sugiyamaella lignohabitans]